MTPLEGSQARDSKQECCGPTPDPEELEEIGCYIVVFGAVAFASYNH